MKVWGEISVSVSLCPPQIPQELASVILGILSFKPLSLQTHKGSKYRSTFNNIQRVTTKAIVCISVQEDYLQRVKVLGKSMDILHSHNLYECLMLNVSIIKNYLYNQ